MILNRALIPYLSPMATPTITAASTTAANNLTTSFSGLTSNVSQSCDLMGTIGSLTNKITHTVVDSVTGAVTTVTESAADVVAEVKNKLSSCFGGSGSVLNSIKGYIAEGQDIANQIAAKAGQISAAIMNQLQSLMDSVNSGIQVVSNAIKGAIDTVVSTMATVRNAVADAVTGMKIGACSAINNVLAGSDDNAFANITSGSSDSSLKNLGAAKDVWNTGGTSLKDITTNISEANGMSTSVTSHRNAATNMQTIVTNAGPQTASIGTNLASMRAILAGV